MHYSVLGLRRCRRFRSDRRGGIAVISAIVFTALVGMSGLVAEYGYGLVMKSENQRIADLAAYSGALAYNASGSTTTMNAAVAHLAALNGLASNAASGSLVTSPTGDGNSAVEVTIATTTPLVLSSVMSPSSTLTAGAGSSAEVELNHRRVSSRSAAAAPA